SGGSLVVLFLALAGQRDLLPRYAVTLVGPLAEITELTSLRTERAVRIARPERGLAASRAADGLGNRHQRSLAGSEPQRDEASYLTFWREDATSWRIPSGEVFGHLGELLH